MIKEKLNYILQKLKAHYGIASTRQFFVILFVFAVTGPTTLAIERLIFHLLQIPSFSHWSLHVLFFVLFTIPVFKLLLLFYGLLFGQFPFFRNFVKAFFIKVLLLDRFKKRSNE